MKGRSFAVLLVLVVACAGAAAWFATREPETVADPATDSAPAVVATPSARKPAAGAPKRPRAGAGTRWIRRGVGALTGRIREYGTDRPLGGIALSIEAGTPGPDRTIPATTAADGTFVVDDVDEFDAWTLRAKAPPPLADAELAGIRVETGRQTDVGIVYLAPAFAVPGIVVDDRGAPVDGADVLAARRTADTGRLDILRLLRELPQRPASIDRAKSGADGRFRLTRLVPGTYQIAAQRAGFATGVEDSVVVTPASAGQEIRIVIRKGLDARGRVTRKGGAPAPGVSVVAFAEPRGNTFVDPFLKVFATTDDAGAFRLEGLAPARYIVAATPEGEPSAINDRVRIPATGLIEITLEGDAELDGTVTGPDDKPVAGAQILVICEKMKAFASATTDDGGRYAVKGLASGEPTAILVTAEGFARHPPNLANVFSSKGAELNLSPGANRKDVKLSGGATVHGTVREMETGTAAQGVRVQLVDGSMGMMGGALGATTDAQGKYAIAGVSPGTSMLTASKEGWYQPGVTAESLMGVMGRPSPSVQDAGPVVVVAEDATAVERDLEIARTGAIRGRVEAPDGTPAAGAQVSVVAEGREDPMSMFVSGTEPRLSDASGAFEMPAPAPGRAVRVVAKRADLAPGRSEPIRGAAGADVGDLVVRLRLAAVMEGRVADADGKPIDGATVRWTAAGARNPQSTGTGADGRWRATLVEPATYTVLVSHPQFLPWAAKGTVVDEGKTVTLDATLQLGVVVTGRVVGPDENPVAGAIVELQPKGRRIESPGADLGRDPIVSGEDGSFRAEGLVPGAYAVMARAEGFVASDRVDVDAPADVVTLRLAQAFTITGVVRMRGGGPVAGLDVRAQAPRPQAPAPAATVDGKMTAMPRPGMQMPSRLASARTGADGRFELKGLPAGPYDLRVDPDASRGPRPNVLPVVVSGIAAGQADVVIDMEPGVVISGTVVLSDGAPAPNGRVSCEIEKQKGAAAVDGGRGMATIADGGFEITGLVPGTYDLSVTVEDHAPKRIKTASGATGLRIEISRGGSLTGRALLPDGASAVGANVSAVSPAGSGSARTDADGRFTIPHLADGTYEVHVWISSRDQPPMRGTATGLAVRDDAATDAGDIPCAKADAQRPGVVPVPPVLRK